MAGFALILHRDGSAVPERVLDRCRRGLGSAAPPPVHGPGGGWCLARCEGTGGYGAGSVHVAFDGRLDDRSALEGALGVTSVAVEGDAAADRDARLLHAAYLRWGAPRFRLTSIFPSPRIFFTEPVRRSP